MKILAILLIPAICWAGPFLHSDPQEGVEEHLFECGDFSVVVPASADGSFAYDMSVWPNGPGWFDCTVKSRSKWEVIDGATGKPSEVVDEAAPAEFRLKVPNNGRNSNFKVKIGVLDTQ